MNEVCGRAQKEKFIEHYIKNKVTTRYIRNNINPNPHQVITQKDFLQLHILPPLANYLHSISITESTKNQGEEPLHVAS